MRLADLIDTYVTFKRSMGMRCRTDAQLLKSFCRATGDIDIAEVRPETVCAFIAGKGPVTATWKQKKTQHSRQLLPFCGQSRIHGELSIADRKAQVPATT